MPNILQLCFSKLKIPSSSPSSPTSSSWPDQNSKKETRNLSQSSYRKTLLINSLCNTVPDFSDTETARHLGHVISTSNNSPSAPSSSSPSSLSPSPPTSQSEGLDLSTIRSSTRFFISSPGQSSAIADEAATGVGPWLAVPTNSPDPRADFRRSMEEIVVAHGLKSVGSNWDQLHELLLCYLALNCKHTHKFIFCAFADLLLSLGI